MSVPEGRIHGEVQFAVYAAVRAYVEMMGVIGLGSNPMVVATVACAVSVEKAMSSC